MDGTLNRKIKIHCPDHQSTFEAVDSPKIVCEIREHALSIDFPNAEFWDYCCDCQTFSPSNLEVGGKAAASCTHCGRERLKRFVCDHCKVVSSDSGGDTKGKIYRIAETNIVEPSCPGCRKTVAGDNLYSHKCPETETVIFTARQNCPFCKKPTAKPKKAKTAVEPVKPECPKCKTLNEPNDHFCKECGEQIRPTQKVAKRGTSTAKTMLLGSLCPTCGSVNLPGSAFCANCGQALKAEPKPPPPLPQPFVPIEEVKVGPFGGSTTAPPTLKSKSSSATGLTAAGVLLLVVAACCVCFNSKSKNTDSSSSYPITNSNYAASNYSSTPYSSTPSSSNSSNSSNSSSDFDRKFSGTIGGRSFSMSLKRTGDNIRGTAATSRTDSVSGTIDGGGNFTLKGYENGGNVQTGTYSGKIYSDGSISGNWKNPQGGQARSFSLTED